MCNLIFSLMFFVVLFFQNYSIRVVDDLGYNLGTYLISDKNDTAIINGEIINFSDFLRYIQKNQNEITIKQYQDIVNKMARIELNRARKKYETTFAQYVMESSTVLKDENVKRRRELNSIKEILLIINTLLKIILLISKSSYQIQRIVILIFLFLIMSFLKIVNKTYFCIRF